MTDTGKALGLGILTLCLNIVLMLTKIVTGILGNSFALVADGIESAGDILTSLISWGGFQLSLRPPDEKHPFGHGKIESLAGMFSGFALMGAALLIAGHSLREMGRPQAGPEWFTLPVLAVVILTKEYLHRRVAALSGSLDSRALEGDAWHHRSDAVTSAATGVGICIAMAGGPEFWVADEWAALVASVIILFNGLHILNRSLHETLDGRVKDSYLDQLQEAAGEVEDVQDIETCRARKSGTGYFVELHVEVDGELSVAEGHEIGHRVKSELLERFPEVMDVVVHVEPARD